MAALVGLGGILLFLVGIGGCVGLGHAGDSQAEWATVAGVGVLCIGIGRMIEQMDTALGKKPKKD